MKSTTINDCDLYLGDCLEVMRTFKDKQFNAAITDPPYGVNLNYGDLVDDSVDAWRARMLILVPELYRIANFVVLPSCQIKELKWIYANIPPDWLISWYKGSPGHVSLIGFNDWEPLLCYGRPSRQMHDYFYAPTEHSISGHPCPKSVPWAKWLVGKSTNIGDSVIDPFMGSGTTGVACVQLQRKFTGIDINPDYFALASKRIEDEYLQPRLIAYDYENTALF